MTIAVLIIVVLALVIGLGVFIFSLMKRSQTVVPDTADRRAAESDRVVALDDQGRPVMESDDAPAAEPRDATAFDNVLGEELKDLHPDPEE
jgi:hypothetical protein